MLRNFLLLALAILISSCTQDPFPLIKITHEGPVGWKEKGACEVVYYAEGDSTMIPAQIKCRGGASSKFHKHSYSIEFDDNITFGDIPADDDWVLNANYIDKTFMRHKMSYDLFTQMGELNLAPKCFYMNLELNKKPRGLYVAMQEVNAGMIGLVKSDTMAMLFKDPPIFHGYTLDFVQDPNNYYQQKYPKKQDSDRTWYLEEFIDFMFNSTDSALLADAEKWIELQNLIDWHLLLLFTNNGDGVMKNFLLYKMDRQTPFRIALWDYDHSFGRDGDYELNMMRNTGEPKRAVIIKRLMEIPESRYPEMLRDRWWQLRKRDILSYENVQRHLEKNDRIIREQIPQNADIWPLDEKWYDDDNSYEEELQLLLDFVSLRIAQLDDYFTEG
ncbi:MAG: CotH kinase family protein [Bacteroides sp.]|nr:CotH kinase family protein [Bacteroides sp.]